MDGQTDIWMQVRQCKDRCCNSFILYCFHIRFEVLKQLPWNWQPSTSMMVSTNEQIAKVT